MSGPSPLFQLGFTAPKRSSLSTLTEYVVRHALLGDTLQRRLANLAHLYDPRVPPFTDVSTADALDVEPVQHPLEWVLAEGPRPDPRYCLQRLRALWLVTENRAGQITNDPVVPFRHQSALMQFLTESPAPRRVLVADEVGLGKTVEAGLLIRHVLRQEPRTRVLYVTLGGLVANVLQEFQRLDLPRWHFYANLEEVTWKNLNAVPLVAITGDAPLVIASIHKLCDSARWQQQHEFLGTSRFDLVIVDECHALRAYGPSADSPQVWFRSIRQLLEDHLTADGRVLFLSATPHQGKRDVFLNLVSLCVGAPLSTSEGEKAEAAKGRVVFRVKEHIRDWDGKRVFPPRDVRPPRLAEPPVNYKAVLAAIADHFDWIAQSQDGPQARAVGFVKSQALQYAASSLRAGFAYLLRRLIRYHPDQAEVEKVRGWATRLLPYRKRIGTAEQLLREWLREFRLTTSPSDQGEVDDGLSEDVGPDALSGELPRLLSLLTAYDGLFDDPEAGAKFRLLCDFVDGTPEPAVIFSQAVDTVYELEARLKERGHEVYRLTGDMPLDERGPVVRAFCRSLTPTRVLLSSAAGGVGINLQVARVAVHFDLPWNPMVLEQRVGRVHRIGSTRTILVETILLRGSREAEVFERITSRLQEIVRDLSPDPVEREALFRRILASLNPDALREILSGEQGIEAVGAAVEAGRRAVDEADAYMQELAAQTSERRGRATTKRLLQFLETADPDFRKVGSRVYAVLTETDGGELTQVQQEADSYRFEADEGELVFDRTAASYLGLRRDETGGLGNPMVDPLLRAAIDLGGEAKARSSTWLIPVGGCPEPVRPGDVVYVACEATVRDAFLIDPCLLAWRVRAGQWEKLEGSVLEQLLWDTEFTPSRRTGELPPMTPESALDGTRPPSTVHFPLAAIGIRER